MPFKPNYNQQRAERNRLKQAKKDAKLRERDEAVSRRKSEQEAASPSETKSAESPKNRDQLRSGNRNCIMKRRSESSFVLFDVTYTDGSRSSNRKVLVVNYCGR